MHCAVQGTLAPSRCVFSSGLVRWPGEGSCVSTCSSLACWGDSSARPADLQWLHEMSIYVAQHAKPSVQPRARREHPQTAALVCRGACSAKPVIQPRSGPCTHVPCHCQQAALSPGTRQRLASSLTGMAHAYR